MKSHVHLIIYIAIISLLVAKPLITNGQQKSLDQLKAELEQKKIEQQLAETEQKRLEAVKATLKVNQEIADADKPVEKTPRELAEERKAISEADAASLKAKKEMLSSPFTGSLSTGTMSATGTFPESNILNQESLAQTLRAMIKDIAVSTVGDSKEKKEITLVIYNAADFNGLISYASLIDQFNQLKGIYSKAVKDARKLLKQPMPAPAFSPGNAGGVEAVSLALTAANSIVQTVSGIIQLFRTDMSFTNSDLAIDEFNLTSLMYSSIRSEQLPWRVFYPAIYPIDVVKRIGGKASQLQQMMRNDTTGLDKQSAEAKIELENIEKKISELTDKAARKSGGKVIKLTEEENTLLSKLTIAKANLQTAEKAYTDVLTSLNTVDAIAKLTPLVMMTRIERLSNLLNQLDTYVVKMVANATGSQKSTKSTFGSSRMEHSAGAILSYDVFKPTGEIICGNGIYNYSPYQESQNIARKSSIPKMFQPTARVGSGNRLPSNLP